MKILSVHFKNINSFEGENRIDFADAQFSDHEVIAITGANGSGKSTIMDAITLALYGETFRLDRQAEHVMTSRTAESFSEIEFSLGVNRYRSSWRVTREAGDPDGELLPIEMQLLQLDGSETVLADTPQLVCDRIIALTGMNFRNFTRCILFEQGHFAAFLHALDSERLAILETLITPKIYDDYKSRIESDHREKSERLTSLQRELSFIQAMTPEQIEAAEHDLQDFNDQYVDFHHQLETLGRQEYMMQQVANLENAQAGLDRDLQELHDHVAAIDDKLAQLAGTQEVLRFQADVEAIGTQDQALAASQATLASYQNELKELEAILAERGIDRNEAADLAGSSFSEQQQSIGDIRYQIHQQETTRHSAMMRLQALAAQSNDAKTELETVSAWLDAHQADELLMTQFPETARLKNLREEISEAQAKRKRLVQAVKVESDAVKNHVSAIDKEQSRLKRLEQQLAEDESSLEDLAQGRTIEEIDELRVEQHERMQSFKELVRLSSDYCKLVGEKGGLFGLFKPKEGAIREADDLADQLKELWDRIKSEDGIRQLLDAKVAEENLKKQMLPFRHNLIDGKPCPLCGAAQHPYVSNPPAIGNTQPELLAKQQKLKALRNNAEQLEHLLNKAQKQAQISRARHAEAQKIGGQWTTLANRLNIYTADLDVTHTSTLENLLQTEEREFKDITFLSAKYKSKQANVEKLKASIEQSRALIERLQSDWQRLDSEWRERPDQLTPFDAGLEELIREEAELAAQVNQQLTTLGEKMPVKGKENAFFDRMNARRRDYLSYYERFKSLKESLHNFASEDQSCRDQIVVSNQKIEQLQTHLKGEEIVGLHLALLEKQKLIADQQQAMVEQKSQLQAMNLGVQEKIQESGIASLVDLKQMLNDLASEPEWQLRRQHLVQDIVYKEEELAKTIQALILHKEGLDATSNLELVRIELRGLREKQDIAHAEIRRLDSLLKDQRLNRQKYDALSVQIQEQQEIVQRSQQDVEAIAQGSGRDLRRMVQERVFERLLEKTNAILEKISQQLYLRRSPSQHGLALAIEDTERNVLRLPKTLSGGENFIVSLALALGLTEMTMDGKSVDTLFIDEGFGNLDKESLEKVLNTLVNLREQNKTVGVISHLDEVKKRFRAQLHVVRQANGISVLKKAS